MVKLSGQPLKIGFVLDGGLEEPDGVQQYILNLGEYYRSLGHSTYYLVAGNLSYGREFAVSLCRSVSFRSNGNNVKLPLLPANPYKIKKYLDSENFDVLHVQVPYLPFLGEQLINFSGKKTAIIGTYHVVPRNWKVSTGNWILGKLSYLSVRKVDQMISVSEVAERIALRDYNSRSVVIPNPINFDRFKMAKPLDFPKNELHILFLGRLVERKGVMDLLKAVVILNNKSDLPRFKLVICGKGPYLNKLQSFAKKNNISQLIEFTGFISEEIKPRYYASADISVFPSTGGESFGIVLLEAMASGKSAVLAANNDGYKSLLADFDDQLFEAGSASDLASKLELLLRNKDKRMQIAGRGSGFAAQFDSKIVGDQILQIYYQALIKKRA